MNRPLDQRLRNSPVLTMIPSSTGAAGIHSPAGLRISRPDTSDMGSNVMKPWSEWGEMPNWLFSGSMAA